MGKTPSMPAAPDPFAMAQAQFQFNNLNTYSPNGNVEYGYVGSDGQFTAGTPGQGQQGAVNIVETPFQSELRGMQEGGVLDLVGSIMGDGVSLPDRAAPRDMAELEAEIFDRNIGRVTEYHNRDRLRQEDRLQNRGIPIGAQSFGDGMDPLLRSQDNAVNELSLAAFDRAGQEQSRQFALDKSARDGALAEYDFAFGGGFNPSPLVQAGSNANIDIAGMMQQNYNSQMQQAMAQMQGRNQMFGNVIGLGGALLSDRNRKRVIEADTPLLEASKSVPVGRWSYDDSVPNDDAEHIGPMAQDFAAAFGVGDGRSIQISDYLGVMFGMIRELNMKFDQVMETV